jgi:CHRD domain
MHTYLTRQFGSRALLALIALVLSVAAGAISAPHAAVIPYSVVLNGPSESPPNASPGTGTATVDVDPVAHTMKLHVVFQDLIGTTSASHIHAATTLPGTGTAGVATTTPTFAGFPLGVHAGTYDITLDMTQASSYNPSYVTAHGGTTAQAEIDLFQAIADGKAYLNIHTGGTGGFPGGEIRGFLQPIPTATEKSTWGGVKALYR